MKFYLFVFMLIFTGCKDHNKTYIQTNDFLPNGIENTQYIYDYFEDRHPVEDGEFITTILEREKNCVKVKDTLKLNKNKIANPKSYKICSLDNNLIAITDSNEFVLISHLKNWVSKVFSYYPIPKERAFIKKCEVKRKSKEKVLNSFIDVLEIECSYTNDLNTKIKQIYKYVFKIGMVEKIEMVENNEIFRLKLNQIK